MRWTVVLVGLLGCGGQAGTEPPGPGPDGTVTPSSKDGSRIKRVFFKDTRTAEDGLTVVSVAQSGFFDLGLNSYCTFDVAEDGVQRCVPPGSAYFTNNKCTGLPIQVVEPAAAAPCPAPASWTGAISSYIVETVADQSPVCAWDGSRTGSRKRVYKIANEISRPPSVFFSLPGLCTPTTPSGNARFYASGEAVPPTDLVKATLKQETYIEQ